ncbi:MAG: CDP-diacylglycerol--serine O-phosphatidyltransferase [bacterium]|nr:CDP-diacylglycerol--serine O-phosphatidyltransferase [bacterium]
MIKLKKNIIPTIISLSSILSGFIAIIMASYDEIQFSAMMILLGAFFDGIDGKIARALKASDEMGKEMDSLADLATFGLAPGYLLYQASLYKLGNWGILVSALIPIFAALRLARFNLKPTKNYFEGVPSTWAGISIAILLGFYHQIFNTYFYLFYAIIISLLMVSSFRYYKPNKEFLLLNPRKILVYILILGSFIINYRLFLLVLIFWYNISGIIFFIFRIRPKKIKSYKINY